MGNAVSALSVIFVLAALARTDFDASWVTDWRAFVLACAVGVLLKAATVFLSAGAWCLWLEFFAGRRCCRREAIRVYAKANIGKYLPGNVMHYVERNLFAAKLGLSQKQLAAASACEVISLVLAALFMGACLDFAGLQKAIYAVASRLLPVDSESFWTGKGFWFFVPAAVFGTAAAVCLLRFLQRKRRWDAGTSKPFREKVYVKRLSERFLPVFMKCFAAYLIVLSVLGAVLAVFYLYLGGKPGIRQGLQILAAYAAAWVLGFVVPGAPGGIGVREMALALLLSPVIGRDRIVVLSVLHRLVTVAGDFAAYLLRKAIRSELFCL